MSNQFRNPLIGTTTQDTFDRLNGMIDLLRAVDYTRVGLTEESEIAHGYLLGMMGNALSYESKRLKSESGN